MKEFCLAPESTAEETGPHLLFTPNEAYSASDFLSPQKGVDPSLLSVSEKSKLLWGSDGLKLRQKETPKRVLSIHKLSASKNRRNTPTKTSPLRKLKTVNFKSPKPTNQGKNSSAVSEGKENNVSASKATPSFQGKGKKFTPRPSRVLTSRDTLSALENSNISPRALKAIILDNPATRAEYLSRQSPSSREQVKMYGTPQLAGRLGVDRFPDAPKHFVKPWTPSDIAARNKRTSTDDKELPQAVKVETINDYNSEALQSTPTGILKNQQADKDEMNTDIGLSSEKDMMEDDVTAMEQDLLAEKKLKSTSDQDVTATEQELPPEDMSIKSATDPGHMYDYFLSGKDHVVASSITYDDESSIFSIDSVLIARNSTVKNYNTNALLSADSSDDISRYVDLDDYFSPDLSESNNQLSEVNEPLVMSTEVAVIDSKFGSEPFVPPEKARCGSCVIL